MRFGESGYTLEASRRVKIVRAPMHGLLLWNINLIYNMDNACIRHIWRAVQHLRPCPDPDDGDRQHAAFTDLPVWGVGFRGHRDWNGEENTEFLTSSGMDRSHGHATRARWCHIGGVGDRLPSESVIDINRNG